MSIKPGALRFNTDSMKLEIFRGSANYEGSASMAGIGTLAAGQWEEIVATSPEAQTGGTRGVFGGGWAPNVTNLIDFITIATTGNAQDFGDLTAAGYGMFGYGSSPTRGVFGPRSTNPGPLINTLDYVELLSTGNAIDFGDALAAKSDGAGFSNAHGGL